MHDAVRRPCNKLDRQIITCGVLFVRRYSISRIYRAMCFSPITIKVKKRVNGVIVPCGYKTVACGKCLSCIQKQSETWALRCMHEAKLYDENCFLTLTYNDLWLPRAENGLPTLCRKDFTNFIKRLRKAISPRKIRVFYCGEYGKKGLRPHYHCVVFGWFPSDAYFFKVDSSGERLFRSPLVEREWSYLLPEGRSSIGFSSVGYLSFNAAKYCAKYLQKILPVPDGVAKPFVGMSNRPGIGFNAISPECLLNGGFFLNGRNYGIPRYYMKNLEVSHDLDSYKESRYHNFLFRKMVSDPYSKLSVKRGKKLLSKLLTK